MSRHPHRTPTLTSHEERRLCRRCAAGDRAARESLICAMRPLARSIARRYARDADHLAELEQVASIGAINAVDRFDPERGVRLASFAFPTVTGEIRRHLRDTSWSVHVPRGLRDLAWRLPGEERDLTAALRRRPTDDELAERLGCAAARLPEVRLALNGFRAATTDHAPDRPYVGTEPGAVDDAFSRTDDRLVLRDALDGLDPVQREALALRFGADLTQGQIGARIGCSQVQVSRLLAGAYDQLRGELAPAHAARAA